MINRLNIDHMTMIALALVAALPFMTLSPAEAATVDCQAQLETVRIEAVNAEPKIAAKALRTAEAAAKICVQGNRFEAGKKFAQARLQLDSSMQFAARR